jgi:hypothetical protein
MAVLTDNFQLLPLELSRSLGVCRIIDMRRDAIDAFRGQLV